MRHLHLSWIFVFVLITACAKEELYIESSDNYSQLRLDMVKEQLLARNIADESVLAAMQNTPRHLFVPEELTPNAYEDRSISIGYGFSMPKPYLVALITQELELDEHDKVLEIGTGSGYQAAILSGLVSEVYTIEVIQELSVAAEERLQRLGYENVKVKNADGYFGWEEHAPYDAVIVNSASDHIPPNLLQQLKDDGKLIIPLGRSARYQILTLTTKKQESRFIAGTQFMPMVRNSSQD